MTCSQAHHPRWQKHGVAVVGCSEGFVAWADLRLLGKSDRVLETEPLKLEASLRIKFGHDESISGDLLRSAPISSSSSARVRLFSQTRKNVRFRLRVQCCSLTNTTLTNVEAESYVVNP